MIKRNIQEFIRKLPSHVILVAATKKRTVTEINQAVQAGITILGENYVQEAWMKKPHVERIVQWHCIGHLQKNKVKRAVEIFDMIQTLDSYGLAVALNRACQQIHKRIPVLIEVNIASEESKAGILPQQIYSFFNSLQEFTSLSVQGLMTMGPLVEEPQVVREYFKKARLLFHAIKERFPDSTTEWKYLSMGMSDTYHIAIEEGANMIRIGSALFGPRN